jgi:hypothetical protein
MADRINEHDKTKEMMSILRGGFKNKIIKEVEEPEMEPQSMEEPALVPGDDLPEPDNGDYVTIDSDNSYWKDELKKMQDVLSNLSVRFTEISYSVPLNDVIVRGEILSTRQGGNNGITFVFSLLGGESTNNIKNKIDTSNVDNDDDDVKNLIKLLGGYYDNWVQDAYNFLSEMNEKEKNQ